MQSGQTFAELLHQAQSVLADFMDADEASRDNDAARDQLVADLYESGRAVGLTSKEVTQALVKTVRGHLRPSLKRL